MNSPLGTQTTLNGRQASCSAADGQHKTNSKVFFQTVFLILLCLVIFLIFFLTGLLFIIYYCFPICILWACVCMCVYFSCFFIFSGLFGFCLFSKERKCGVEQVGWWQALREDQGRKAMVRISCMRKTYFQLKNKNKKQKTESCCSLLNFISLSSSRETTKA